MLRTSPFSPPEPTQGLGARLPRPSEAAVPPPPPREIRPGVFLSSDGKMFTQLEVPKPAGADAEMLRQDQRGLSTPWRVEGIAAEIYREMAQGCREPRVPKVGDLIRVRIGPYQGAVRSIGEFAGSMFYTAPTAADRGLVFTTSRQGDSWEFAS